MAGCLKHIRSQLSLDVMEEGRKAGEVKDSNGEIQHGRA